MRKVKTFHVMLRHMKNKTILLLVFFSLLAISPLQADASLLNIREEIDELNDSISGINDGLADLNSIICEINRSFDYKFSFLIGRFGLSTQLLEQKFDTLNNNIGGIDNINTNLCKATDAIQDFFSILIILFISAFIIFGVMFFLIYNKIVKKIGGK